MPPTVAYTPLQFDFGWVPQGSKGESGLQIPTVPVSARVTAKVIDDVEHFAVRNLIAHEWVMHEVHFSALPRWHKGPLPKQRVLTEVNRVDGQTPLAVKTGQYMLVIVTYSAEWDGTSAVPFRGRLVIDGNGQWQQIEVPLSLALGEVQTGVPSTPLTIAQGQSADLPISVQLVLGPETDVVYEKRYLTAVDHSGLTLTETTVHVTPATTSFAALTFRASPDAPLGGNAVSVDQVAFNGERTSFLVSVSIVDKATAPAVAPSIVWEWEVATRQGILVSEDDDAWNAGRVHDVLSLGNGALLVGAALGGVWGVTRVGQALPHSDQWENPDINCLARGLDENRFYAGCGGGGALYESEPETFFLDYMSWHEVPLVDRELNPLATGAIYRIAVVAEVRKLVLACHEGVFWSDIPVPGHEYLFTRVASQGFSSSVASGPNGSVVAAGWSNDTQQYGIFLGDWSSGDLLFTQMTIPDAAGIFWTTLASCEGDLNRAYAAAGDGNENLIGIWSYDHRAGDKVWVSCRTDAVDADGNPAPQGKDVLNSTGDMSYGGLVKTLHVAPTNPDLVTINWARTFLSDSGGHGRPWIAIDQFSPDPAAREWSRRDGWEKHGHEDGHATVFDTDDSGVLYLATDGGVAKTTDRGHNWESRYNAQLANLMFDGDPAREGAYEPGPA